MILVTYLLLILVTFAIGFGAQGYVNHQLNKYSHVPNTSQMTGRDVAVLIHTTVGRSRRPQLLVMRWGMRASSRKTTNL